MAQVENIPDRRDKEQVHVRPGYTGRRRRRCCDVFHIILILIHSSKKKFAGLFVFQARQL